MDWRQQSLPWDLEFLPRAFLALPEVLVHGPHAPPSESDFGDIEFAAGRSNRLDPAHQVPGFACIRAPRAPDAATETVQFDRIACGFPNRLPIKSGDLWRTVEVKIHSGTGDGRCK